MSPRRTDQVVDELRQLREQRDAGQDFMSQLAEGFEKIDRLTSGNQAKILGEVFSSKEIKEYNKGLRDVRQNIRFMNQEYRRLTDEVQRMNEEMDDIEKKGGFVSRGRLAARDSILGRRSEIARSIASGEGRLASGEQYLQRQQESRAARNRLKIGAAVALGGLKGYALARLMQGVNVRTGQEQAALQAEGALGVRRGVYSLGWKGMGLGINPVQAMSIAGQTGRAVGRFDRSGSYSNMLLSQGRNLSVGDLTGYQRAARFAGDKSLGKALNDTLVASFKASGANPALLEEFLRGSSSLLQKMGGGSTSYSAREASGTLGILMRSLGGAYQRSPERTAGLIGRLNAGMQPGGNDATMGFKLRAVGFGQGLSYWQSIKQIEKGATSKNIQSYIGLIKREYGGMSREDQVGALYRLMGGNIKYHEAESLYDANGLTSGIAGIRGGVNQGKLKAHIRRRTGDTRRTLGRQQAMANFAGTKEAQQLLDLFAKFDKGAISLLKGPISILADAAKKAGQSIKFLNEQLNKLNTNPATPKQVSHARSVPMGGVNPNLKPDWAKPAWERRRNIPTPPKPRVPSTLPGTDIENKSGILGNE